MKKVKSKLTKHRGNSRFWLEGKYLAAHGFTYHTTYSIKFLKGRIELRLDPDGDRAVSGRKRKGATEWTPIIDCCCVEVAESLGRVMFADVTVNDGLINATPYRS